MERRTSLKKKKKCEFNCKMKDTNEELDEVKIFKYLVQCCVMIKGKMKLEKEQFQKEDHLVTLKNPKR